MLDKKTTVKTVKYQEAQITHQQWEEKEHRHRQV